MPQTMNPRVGLGNDARCSPPSHHLPLESSPKPDSTRKEKRRSRRKCTQHKQQQLAGEQLKLKTKARIMRARLQQLKLPNSPVALVDSTLKLMRRVLARLSPRQANTVMGYLRDATTVMSRLLTFLQYLDKPSWLTYRRAEANIAPHNKAVVNSTTFSLLIERIRLDSTLPHHRLLTLTLNNRRADQGRFAEFKKQADAARGHLRLFGVLEESEQMRQRVKGKTGWSCPRVDLADGHQSHHVKTEIRSDGNILISQYLPLRRTSEPVIHPYTDILYSIPELKQLAATDPALLPLLDPDRDESDELSPALLDALHLATRSYDDIVKLVRFVRVDYNGACGFKRVQHRSILRSVATEIARTGWSRGSAHRCTGYATGLGFRNDQRGGVGQYSNFKQKKRADPAVLQDQKIQRCLADYMYGVTHIIPALLAQLQAETSKADMLGIGAAGVAGTLSVMVGFDAALHWENAQDPDYSCGICLGAKDDSLTPLGAFDFALPALNNGRGIVVENGPGVMMIWMGKKTTHGTSFRWVEKRETGDSAPRAGEELDLRGGARNAGRGGPAGNTRSRAVPRNGRRAGVCQWQKGSTMARAKSKGKQAVVRPEGSKKGGAKKRAVGVSLDVGSGVGMPLNYGR